MMFKNLKIENHEPGIKCIKISRPEVLNALNTETLTELHQCLQETWIDEKTRVVILTGDGEKAFIAGADISEMSGKSAYEGVAFAQLGQEVTKLLELMPKPTIAAVNGFALGGGSEMAIACDFILASEKAVFGQPEVGLGIIPGYGATVRLAKFVGWPMAKELIFSGRKVKAEEAKQIGLANQVFAQGEFFQKVLEVAKSISIQSFSAVSQAKKLMNQFGESVGLHEKLYIEAQSFSQLFGSDDQREGMSAFLEKRKPKFQGL